ncbi:MAG: hotdog fold domain-containing protein [Pseudomonadota bacterium]
MSKPNKNLQLWRRLNGNSAGRWLFGKLVGFAAPYFRTIKPRFLTLEPGHVEIHMRNRRAVQNHLQSVHAIAMCNAAELVGGLCLDVSLDSRFRWIPVGMTVQYLKMAKTDLVARCQPGSAQFDQPGDVVMPVGVFDTNGVEVFHADITMRVSQKRH